MVEGLGYGLRVTGYGLRVTGYGLRVTGYGLRVTGLGFRVSGFVVGRFTRRSRSERSSSCSGALLEKISE